jgi:pyochelin synthetase
MEHATFSGIEVLRELGRRRETRAVYPVVFTSMLGLGKESRLDGDFMRDAQLVYSISQTPQVWLDCQVSERQGELRLNWDLRDGVFRRAWSRMPSRLLKPARAAGPGAGGVGGAVAPGTVFSRAGSSPGCQ